MYKVRTSTIKKIEYRLSEHEKYSKNSKMKIYAYKYAVLHLIRVSDMELAMKKLLNIPFLLNMHWYCDGCYVITHAFNILGDALSQKWIENLPSVSIKEHQWARLIDIFHCMSHYSIATEIYTQFQMRNVEISNPEDQIDFLRSIFILHTSIAKYERMIDIGEKLLSMLEKHPQFQEEYLFSTRSELPLAYEGLSEYDKANEIMTSLWAERPKNSTENINYLGLYLNLANLRNRLGDEKSAVEMYIEIIEILEKQEQTELGIYHTTRHNLASCYSDLGQKEEALQMQEDLYEDTLKNKGKYHSDTALGLYCLARTSYMMDNYTKAESYAQKALEINKRVYGMEHEQTVSTLNLLGHVYSGLKNLEKAEQILLDCREYGSLIWPAHSIYMLSIYDGLYEVFEAKKEYGKAQEAMIAYAEGHRKVFGDETTKLGTTYWRLYILCKKQNKLAEALDYAQKCFHIELNTEGFSKDTKVTSGKIVELLLSTKNYEDIVGLFQQIKAHTQINYRFVLFLVESIEKGLSHEPWVQRFVQYFEHVTKEYAFSVKDLKAMWKMADLANTLQAHQRAVYYRRLCVDNCIREYGWDNQNTLLTIIQCLKDMSQAQRTEDCNNLVAESIQNLSHLELNEECEAILRKITRYRT